MDSNDRKLFIQLVAQVLIADAILSDDEHDYLESLIVKHGLTPEERKEALRGISMDSPLEERIKSLSPAGREALVNELMTTMLADGKATRNERVVVEEIRTLVRTLG